MARLTYGEANAYIVLTAEKMGCNTTPIAKECAKSITQGDSIDSIHMGTFDAEASRLHNTIRRDKRIKEANKIASELVTYAIAQG
jgi:hypothetical protein